MICNTHNTQVQQSPFQCTCRGQQVRAACKCVRDHRNDEENGQRENKHDFVSTFDHIRDTHTHCRVYQDEGDYTFNDSRDSKLINYDDDAVHLPTHRHTK